MVRVEFVSGDMRRSAQRTLLVLGLLYGVAIALGAGALLKARDTVEHDIGSTVKVKVASVSGRVEAAIGKADDALTAAMEEFEGYRTQRITKEALNAHLSQLGGKIDSPVGIRIADKNGLVVSSDGEGRVSVSGQAYFSTLRDNARVPLVVSRPVYDKRSRDWLLLLAKRIPDVGRKEGFSGVAYTAVRLKALINTLDGVDAANIVSVELRDEAFMSLGQWPMPDTAVASATGQPAALPDESRQVIASQPNGVPVVLAKGAQPGANGKVVVGAQRMGGRPFYVFVSVDTTGSEVDCLVLCAGMILALGVAILGTANVMRGLYKTWGDGVREMQHFRTVVNEAPLGMEVVSLTGEILFANRALCLLLGYEPEMLRGKWLSDITALEDVEKDNEKTETALGNPGSPVRWEKRYLRRDGGVVWMERTISVARDAAGRPQYLVAQCEDISARKEHLNRIQDMAYYDTLTKLPNRRMLMDQLERGLNAAKWNRAALALMFVDLDGFKGINDTLGHDIGDEILKAAAQRLSSCVRGGDLVARQGGDEFVIVLREVMNPASAELVARKVVETMREPIDLDGHTLKATASIGVALYIPPEDCSVDELMKRADTAMYCTKQAGRNGFTVFKGEGVSPMHAASAAA